MTIHPLVWRQLRIGRPDTRVTCAAAGITALCATLLVLNFGDDSSPPAFTATCAATAIVWMYRIALWRRSVDHEADEKILSTISAQNLARQDEDRTDAKFLEITEYLREIGEDH